MQSSEQIQKELRNIASEKVKKINQRFYKMSHGEYGVYDRFLGIKNPEVRKIAKKYTDCDFEQLQRLIISQYNEERLCVLFILINKFNAKNISESQKQQVYVFFVKNLDYINNWNLVDLSASHIMGQYLVKNKSQLDVLEKLVISENMWHRRICIVSTWAFIKRNNFRYTLRYAEKLLNDKEDLIHKAVGWMLREVWKRDKLVCERFLIKNYDNLSRTTLRYAIERMDSNKRIQFLKGNF